MNVGENGYATATVIGLMAVLSLGSSVLLNASLTENQRAKRIYQQVKIDTLLEGELNRLIAEGLNSPSQFKLGQKSIEVPEQTIVAEITDEQSRPDLLRDDRDKLSAILETAGLSSSELSSLLRISGKSGQIRHLDDLGVLDDLAPNAVRCLEDTVTLYRSSLNPLSRPAPQSLDGAIVRFELKTDRNTKPTRRLRAIVLFTGDRETPYHIMDWRQDNDARSPSCKTL